MLALDAGPVCSRRSELTSNQHNWLADGDVVFAIERIEGRLHHDQSALGALCGDAADSEGVGSDGLGVEWHNLLQANADDIRSLLLLLLLLLRVCGRAWLDS